MQIYCENNTKIIWIIDYMTILDKGWNRCYKYENIAKQGTTCMLKILYYFSITEK